MEAKADSPQWEEFGDWKVAAVHDDMDPVPQVVVKTTFQAEDGETFAGSHDFGFRVFGGTLIALDVDYDLGGRNYWPYCDYDTASYKVDGGSVSYLATIDGGGTCDEVANSVIRQFQAGSTAKLKLDYTTGTISLQGFSDAWKRMQQLSR